MNDGPTQTLEQLLFRLGGLTTTAPPQVAALARWSLEHPQELAFHSVRGLAEQAEVNANTVVRLALALGFEGFEHCRAGFQAALRQGTPGYGTRAAELRGDSAALPDRIRASAMSNTTALFSDALMVGMEQTVDVLSQARRIHCIGVRSCFSVAHYLAYTGRMAFDSFCPALAEPGAILDSVLSSEPEDAIVLITFSHYSSEVLKAHSLARELRVPILALTDSHASPIATDAAVALCLPMAGPQLLPSLGAYFLLVETIVAMMVARSELASDRIARSEARLLEFGGYVGSAERS